MEDSRIIDLYWVRDEQAIPETGKKYGKYCHQIAYRILSDELDSEECVSDTYLHAWNTMPPKRPDVLSAFLGRITRNLALDRCVKACAQKRGGGEYPLVLEEMNQCVPDRRAGSDPADTLFIRDTLNGFLGNLSSRDRKIFVRRYWYLSPLREIARDYGLTESGVKMVLLRARNELKQLLAEGGITV